MQTRALVALLLLLAAVPASSLLGLARPMVDEPVDGGWDLFGDVWQASFWGDALFVLGTVAATAAGALLARAALRQPGGARWPLLALCAGAVLLLHWAVYALSWSATLHPYMDEALDEGEGSGFWGWEWDMVYDEPLLGLESAWTFTWCWGWPGLLLAALATPLGAWALHRPAPAAAPAAPAPAAAKATPAMSTTSTRTRGRS